MSPTVTAIAAPESLPPSGSSRAFDSVSPVAITSDSAVLATVRSISAQAQLESAYRHDDLNAAWTQIVQSVTNRVSAIDGPKIITVDLAQGESAQDFSTRLQMLLLFMNRDTGSVSATVSPSFKDDTYPAMLALVKGFQSSGAGEDWRPDGPRSIRMGNARHLFVSVDMPVADQSPSPDTLIEIVAAHRINTAWYDQRVSPRASSTGLTTVMFGVPNSPDPEYTNSIFKQERTKNLSGRSGGIHFSRQLSWPAVAAV